MSTLFHHYRRGLVRVIGLIVRREASHRTILTELLHGVRNQLIEIKVLPRKSWFLARAQPEQIFSHQDLAVAVGASPDSYGWNLKGFCDLPRYLGGHAL